MASLTLRHPRSDVCEHSKALIKREVYIGEGESGEETFTTQRCDEPVRQLMSRGSRREHGCGARLEGVSYRFHERIRGM